MSPLARIAFAALLALLLPPAAHAQRTGNKSGFKLTVVARVCPTYDAIMANRARNDIQESLKPLGKDTAYKDPEEISPDIEGPNQPNCEPLNGWEFRLGTGYKSRAVQGPWGSLSIITGQYESPQPETTKQNVPILNYKGEDTKRTIDGAFTMQLSKKQADRAAEDSQLWIQGGTVEDPILDQRYRSQYGFGALRCAIDNLNGDNVEWIAYPGGTSHVFCYAYYVKPPPTSGTIIVRKHLDAPAGTASTVFGFTGSISYNEGGRFSLTAAPLKDGSQTFYRAETAAGEDPWTIQEDSQTGWRLTGLECKAAKTSAVETDLASGFASIRLAAGDVVTCTYTNALTPPVSGLTLGKVTLGGTGTTTFTLAGASAPPPATVTTSEPGTEVTTRFDALVPGDYTVTERPEESPRGEWRRDEVRCNGAIMTDASEALSLTLRPDAGLFCTFFNEFVPDGSITVRKRTFFRTGTTSFVITRVGSDPPEVYTQTATTTAESDPVRATGDSTDTLPLGTYDIQETTTSNADGGSWELDQVSCDGLPFGSAEGRIRVRLTPAHPSIDCTFSNRHRERPPGADVLPATEEGGPANPVTNLVVRKTVTPRRIVAGETVRYRVTVINRGDYVAEDVVGSETRPPSGTRVNVTGPRGVRCRSERPLVCTVGDMPPHSRITLTAEVRTPRVGRVVNRVAVHTATAESRLGDNRARAVLHVRRLPRFTG